jgi:signal transduction histidine kinase
MAKRVSEVIQSEFDYEVVGILDYDNGAVSLLSSATSKRVAELEASVIDEHDTHTPVAAPVVQKTIETKAPQYTESVQEICGIVIPETLCSTLQQNNFIRSSFAYPLMANGELQGVLLLSLNRTEKDLAEYERAAMASFVSVIAITFEKVRLYEELQYVNHQQESLLHFVSHEVKGYLGKSAAAFAAIIEGDFGAVPETLKTAAQGVLIDVRKGVDTVMDILDSSNMKKGTLAINKQPFDMKTAVEIVAGEQKSAADEKKLALQISIGPGTYQVLGDEDKMRRHVIRNLIDNSIKYTPAGTVTVSLTREGATIRFMVSDTGVGITPEDMARLFTEGGHGKDSVKINVHSTGYGLFIAKQIIVAQGGKIWAESDGEGKGARFIVEVPANV